MTAYTHPLAASFDEMWIQGSPSKMARAALVSRALTELPATLHAPWGARIAHCLHELAQPSNPLLPDGDRLAQQEGHHNFSHTLSWSLLSLASERASLDAGMEALRQLKVQGHDFSSQGAAHAPALSRALLKRLAQDKRHADMNEILAMGHEPSLHDLPDMLVHEGAMMDHKKLAARILVYFRNPEPVKSNHYQSEPHLAAQGFRNEFYCCPHPAWRKALIAPFTQGTPTLAQLANLILIRDGARQIMLRSPEQVERARLAYEANPAAKRVKREWISFDKPERSAAQSFFDEANAAYTSRLTQMAKTSPAAAAQILLSSPPSAASVESISKSWSNIGLDQVDAAEFLFLNTQLFPKRGVSQIPSGARKIWPLFTDKDSKTQATGIMLNLMDCMALSAAPREALQAAADLGLRPSANLSRVMDLPAATYKFSEQDALWLASFAGNPAASKNKRILKA
jgi:hypothetical protein